MSNSTNLIKFTLSSAGVPRVIQIKVPTEKSSQFYKKLYQELDYLGLLFDTKEQAEVANIERHLPQYGA